MAMTDEERRAKNAAKQREYRARKAAERAAAKVTASNAPNPAAPSTTMQDAVDEALAAMKWLVPSDVAAKAQARELARTIDECTDEGNVQKALSAHGRLSRVLSELGGTPMTRLQRELRSLKHAPPKTEEDDGEGEGRATLPANVSKFERPAKRRT